MARDDDEENIRMVRLVEQARLDRSRILHLEKLFLETQQQLSRLTDFVSAMESRLAEEIERVDIHLERHIGRCPEEHKE